MRWIIGIIVIFVSSLLGLFTSYATVNIFEGKIITPKPEANIIGLKDNEPDYKFINEVPSVFNADEIEPDDTFDEKTEEAKPYKLFLIMGTDVVYSAPGYKVRSLKGRTDVIIIAKMTNDGIDLVSIPRDSRVAIPGHGFDKINSANVYGGPELVLETIEKWLNIHIDDYALINTYGVVQFVDLFGGIDFNIPKRMYYTDRAAGLFINLYPGVQHLDGLKVHNFLRFRHDGMGDLNRVKRQQEIIKAMIPQILKPTSLLKIPSMIKILNTNVETNISTRKMLYIANKALQINGLKDKLTMHTLPGDGRMYHGGWYWLIDENKSEKLLQELALISLTNSQPVDSPDASVAPETDDEKLTNNPLSNSEESDLKLKR